MELGFYPRYDRMGASSRLRFFAFFDRWQDGGDSVRMHPGLSDGYLRKLYRDGSVPRWVKLYEWAKLARRAMHLERNLVIEYELMPGVPWSVESRFLANRRYVLNFDDMVWEKYRGNPRMENKFDELCRHASGVIVANEVLLEKVAKLNANVILIPTVVDLDAYPAGNVPKFERFTVAWIGTPVTYMYLEQNLTALQRMSQMVDFELLVIARKDLASRPLPGVKARYEDWSPEVEAELLARSHVGIMPLASDEFSRGKSAYKLIQFQAAGLPSIASPVGENRRILEEGKTGFFAETPEMWGEAVKRLADDSGLRQKMGAAARAKAGDFSIRKYFPIYQEFLRKSFA